MEAIGCISYFYWNGILLISRIELKMIKSISSKTLSFVDLLISSYILILIGYACKILCCFCSSFQLGMAEECLKQASDLSGLLLLYSSLGNADGISELASLAKEHGKNNVAFLCLFMLGKLEDCLQLLVDR